MSEKNELVFIGVNTVKWKGELSGLEFQLCILAGALQEHRVSHVPELS